ncbi:hypothetical protein RJ640_005045 [Escallonia rubra]|uniref:ARM repeat superfamily protein n=1 Tax=Escallonia rubra TaxID=112253 RepID=A0AA88R879_9ASTE|nr:hypothetical protein RJ640_005045 [Escallonia rubra]
MEEIRAYTGESMSINSGDGEEARSSIFPELKHYCLELLGLLQNPKKNTSTLSQLLHLLRRHPPDALQPFFDYALFPLLLLFDAAVDCRSPPKTDSEERMIDVPKPPHKVSDPIAEGVLQCLEELLKKCHLGSVNQMVVMLKKLTYGALLSPSEASEEFREGVIRCFRALLLGLSLCSEETCLCKQIKGWPLLLARRDHQTPQTRISNFDSEPQECILSFLQSQTASAAVGHWLSILLKAADVEAARGHRGSAKLRAEAFMTLRVLVGKVGTADALAFFLPGVVSQFGKVLHVSKTMISGAAGSVETMDQAVRGLAEFLMIVLDDSANLSSLDVSIDDTTGLPINKAKSPTSLLEELRHLPVQTPDQNRFEVGNLRSEVVNGAPPKSGVGEKTGSNSDNMIGSLHVDRTKEWISKTSSHVEKLLCSTFPHLCVHPAKKVRLGLLAAIQGLLSKCSYTLKESRLMLLECLFILVCDDSEEVSGAAQVFLRYLFLSSGKHHIKLDVADIFSSLIERIPKVVLGGEESVALSHAQKLLVVVYFSGPQLVKDHLLQSPVTAARFLDAFALCLGQNSVFAGSLHKFIAARPSSTGYLHSIAEMRAINCFTNDNKAVMDADPSDDPSILSIKNKRMLSSPENVHSEYKLPRLPPWFANVGSQKLYQTLAKILRLVGLSLVAGSQGESNLSIITDIPLGHLRKLVSEVRMKQYSKESWQSWYHRSGSGQLVRRASTAACILNEIIYGLSDQGIDAFARMFQKSRLSCGEREGYNVQYDEIIHCKLEYAVRDESVWKFSWEEGGRSQLIDCIGSILHEYLSTEVWELPLELKSSLTEYDSEVIIDGIGISSICLKGEFSSSGFLQSSLYVLLENLICSNFLIRSASDAVLHVISATSGYPTVGHLVLANADYVIDSICRQLRHLDLNPHVPSVLAAMLSYIGVAYKILPLLEEPMRSVSLELEILGRHHHPDLTIPFLKAVEEIAKASKREAGSLPTQAESYLKHVESEMTNLEREIKEAYDKDMDMNFKKCEQLESTLIRLNDSKRYRRTVGSIAGSCITAAIPLLASVNQAACLIALNIVEDGIFALAKVEEAYRHEKATQEVIRQIFELCSLHDLRDALDADEDGAEENRLLPAMNKIWPFFVACVRSRNPVAVRKCFGVISSAVQICGGDFFSRRFHTDGPHFWKLLNTSPFQKKLVSKEERSPLQLPYRSATSAEDSVAEVSDLKVQAAVLDMIADLSRNKKSASALEAVIKKVSGLVVGIACSCVTGLRSASVNALVGLSCMDPDLVWLLLADVYYSLKKTNIPSPPARDLPEISQMLPPPSSPKGYLYVQYGGQSYGFDIDLSSVEMAFKTLQLQAFTSEVHSQT